MSGKHSISIAVLSDNEDDAQRINSTLRDEGHAAHCQWVSKPSSLNDTLSDHQVELIILNCDSYADSIRQVVRQKDYFNPEVPVIALQEEASEMAIHSAMKSGAVDLVSIGMRKRLTAVVTRELRALRAERALNSTIQSASGYKRQIKDLMQATTASIALVQEGIVVDVNESWLKLLKIEKADEVCGMPLMDSFVSDDHAALKGALVATIAGKWQAGEKLEARLSDGAESPTKMNLGFSCIEYDGAPCVQISIAAEDKPAVEPTKLVHDALKRDPTTLFFHRAQFLERLKKRLAKKPKSGLHLLVYVKLDKFREIRDKIGVIDSEELLAQFSEIVRKRLHPRDIAGRFEGTSLMVLMERGNANDGLVWGQQMAKKIDRTTFEVGDKSTRMTCTVGVCPVTEVFSSLEELVASTVNAHALGKKAGGNTAFLDESTDENTKQREFDAIWVKHLKSALMENRFRLAQLPIAGLRSDGISMYDLLVRMIDEMGNAVLPSDFLPAAERNKMMKNIDRWMIKAAIEFCGSNDADRVFVRLSRQSLVDSTTASWMKEEFERTGFEASRLVTQIPEKDAAKHIKQAQALVSELKKLGVGFALEHYGVDQERFQILDLLKPDFIKIDGELMHSLMTDSQMQSSVEKIVRGAQERDIKTIAERVENANAMAVLFQLGLDFMQGHYVHEPEVVLEDQESGTFTTLEDLQAAGSN